LSAHTVDESDEYEYEEDFELAENVQKLQQKMVEMEEILNQVQQKLINLDIDIRSTQTKIAEEVTNIDEEKKQFEKISLLRKRGQATAQADLIRRQADIADLAVNCCCRRCRIICPNYRIICPKCMTCAAA
jgi:hypothetical protein